MEERFQALAPDCIFPAQREAAVVGLVGLDRTAVAEVQILVGLLVVERTGVVQASTEGSDKLPGPGLADPVASCQALVVLSRVPWIRPGIQKVTAEVHRQLVGLAPLQILAEVKELALHIGLEAGSGVVAALAPLYVDKAAGEVAIFN